MTNKELTIKAETNYDLIADEKLLKEAKYANELIQQQIAYGTKRVYQSDWRIFES